MPKQAGMGDALFLDQFDISGDVAALDSLSTPIVALDFTDITQFAMARKYGLADGKAEFTTYYDSAVGAAHRVISGSPGSMTRNDRVLTYCRSTTLGGPALTINGKVNVYEPSRAADGSFPIKVAAEANQFGAEWGRQHTAGKRSDVAPTNGSPVDFGSVGVAFGLQAYLHVFSFTGTSVTVKLQESSDNGPDVYADVVGGAFTAVSAVGTQRIQTSRTLAVERFLRVVTTGTFSQCTFAVNVVRNLVRVDF